MSGFNLQITTTTPSARFHLSGRGFIIELHTQLQKWGSGSCHGIATEASVSTEIQTTDRDLVNQLIDAFVLSITKTGINLTVVMTDTIARPLLSRAG